jgi:hypothetical protein
MDLEWRRGRVGDDRPVDVASREPQRPSRRLRLDVLRARSLRQQHH